MNARIMSTSWESDGAVTSTLENGQTFAHDSNCAMEDSPFNCSCYVSRIRLIKTPVGETIATTEPDRKADVRYWYTRARHAEARCNVLWIGMLIVLPVACISLFALVYELGLA